MEFSGSHPWAFPGGKVPRGRGSSPSGWEVAVQLPLEALSGALRGKVTARRPHLRAQRDTPSQGSGTHAAPGSPHLLCRRWPRRVERTSGDGAGAGLRVNQRSRPFRDLFQRIVVNFFPKAKPTSFHRFKGWHPQVRGPGPRGFRGQGRGAGRGSVCIFSWL